MQSLSSCEETVSWEDEESSQCETDDSDWVRNSADASKSDDDDTNKSDPGPDF